MKNLKDIVIGILFIFIVYLLLINSCNDTNIETKINYKDSTITITRDTIIPKDTLIKHYIKIPFYDTIKDYNDSSKYLKRYTSKISDTLIDGTLITIVDGVLISNNFEYTPKFPLIIKETTTLEVKVPYKVPYQKNALWLGAEVGGNKNTFNNISLKLDLTTNKDLMFGYRLQTDFNNLYHNFSISKKISIKSDKKLKKNLDN